MTTHLGRSARGFAHPLVLLWSALLITASAASAGSVAFEQSTTLSEGINFDLVVATAVEGSWIYCVWIERADSGEPYNVRFARSSDGGKTFQEPVTLRSTSESLIHSVGTPALAVSGDDVFVAWRETTTQPLSRISLRRSNDRGATFSSATSHSGAQNGSLPRLAAAGGRLHLLYRGSSGALNDLYVTTSSDSGQTFASPVNLNTGLVDRASLAASGDSLWVAWGNAPGVWIRRSENGGQSFLPEQPLSTTEFAPVLAASGNDLYLATLAPPASSPDGDFRGGGAYDVQLHRSQDSGASFTPLASTAGTAIAIQPTLVAMPGLVAAGWRDNSQAWVGPSRDGGLSFDPPIPLGTTRTVPALASRGLGLTTLWADETTDTVRTTRTTPRPLVFVPGVAGSVLYDRVNDRELCPAVGGFHHSDLSLHPEDDPGQFDLVATEPIRAGATFLGYEIEPIYGPFIDFLSLDLGLHPYDVTNGAGTFVPARLTEAGCDLSQGNDAPTPELFLFPYDWRRDNALNASRLADYLGCVRILHPDSEVSIVTHSMGSLLTRRFILDANAGQQPDRLVTIGAPWLGAPKMYNVLDTGDFGVIHISDSTIKHIIGSFDGAHQLIPSRAYTEDLGPLPPLVEAGRDLDGDGVDDEVFTHDRLIEVADAVYGQTFEPGTTGETFHSNPGQDDWSAGSDDIGYFHIYGEQSSPRTIGQVKTRVVTICNLGPFLCNSTPFTDLVLTSGDGTVPTVSASRQANGFDLNHPDATLWPVVSPGEDEDVNSEHNGLMRNPEVHHQVVSYLFSPLADSAAPTARSNTVATGPSAAPPPQHRLLVAGAPSTLIQDESSNEILIYPSQILGSIPGVGSFRLGNGVSMMALPTTPGRSFTVGFVTGSEPMMIEIETGTEDEVTRAVRFLDLALAPGRSAMLTISGTTISDLTYDSTGDGALDATITPTADATGAEAADTVPPVISIVQTPSGNTSTPVTLEIEAADAVSGVATAYYSLDSSQYQAVSGPIDVNSADHPMVWVFADDALGNRATRVVSIIDPDLVFADGFESGNLASWSSP